MNICTSFQGKGNSVLRGRSVMYRVIINLDGVAV